MVWFVCRSSQSGSMDAVKVIRPGFGASLRMVISPPTTNQPSFTCRQPVWRSSSRSVPQGHNAWIKASPRRCSRTCGANHSAHSYKLTEAAHHAASSPVSGSTDFDGHHAQRGQRTRLYHNAHASTFGSKTVDGFEHGVVGIQKQGLTHQIDRRAIGIGQGPHRVQHTHQSTIVVDHGQTGEATAFEHAASGFGLEGS